VRADEQPTLAAPMEDPFRRHGARDATCCIERRLGFRDVDYLPAALGADCIH